jgi:hypothetical protein
MLEEFKRQLLGNAKLRSGVVQESERVVEVIRLRCHGEPVVLHDKRGLRAGDEGKQASTKHSQRVHRKDEEPWPMDTVITDDLEDMANGIEDLGLLKRP